MRELFFYIFHAVLIGMFSYVYAIILTQPHMVLGPVVKFIDPFFTKNGKILNWIYKPLIDCAHCNSGQIALWTYLFYYWGVDYNFFYHIGFIVIAITTVQILISKYGR